MLGNLKALVILFPLNNDGNVIGKQSNLLLLNDAKEHIKSIDITQVHNNHHMDLPIPCRSHRAKQLNSVTNECVDPTPNLRALAASILILTSTITTTTLLSKPVYATTSFDEYFTSNQQYQDPRKVKAKNELKELMNLQDSRLDLCKEKGKNWEHCFMFGESPSISPSQKNKSWWGVNQEQGLPYGEEGSGRGMAKQKISIPTW